MHRMRGLFCNMYYRRVYSIQPEGTNDFDQTRRNRWSVSESEKMHAMWKMHPGMSKRSKYKEYYTTGKKSIPKIW